MKHLQKFNEALKYSLSDTEYINNCFVELTDSYNIIDRRFEYGNENLCYYSITIQIEVDYNYKNDGYDLKTFLSLSEKLSDISEKVDDAVNKVKIKYDNIEVIVDFFKKEGDENTYYFNLDIQ
jgi:hypothetical protein